MLFWLFLHTPMTVIERHGHAVEWFPPTTEDLPCGTDATINEGWLDLKVRNDTVQTFQIEICFDDRFMYGRILSQNQNTLIYERLCRTMKPIWINKVREKQDKSGGIVPPPEIPTMKPLDWEK